MANVETYDREPARLAAIAIRNPTPENINKSVDASIEAARLMTKYIIENNKKV